jgi:hypothetical protein
MIEESDRKMYFSVEMNTGAVNGFYPKEEDCKETTLNLAIRFKGSQWIMAQSIKKIGNTGRVNRDGAFQQDETMRNKLISLFGEYR